MNRAELLAYAQALPTTPSVQALLQGIDEAKIDADHAVISVKNVVNCIDIDQAHHQGLHEVSNMVHFAVKYERAHARLTALFLTLAQTLQGMGHKIDF